MQDEIALFKNDFGGSNQIMVCLKFSTLLFFVASVGGFQTFGNGHQLSRPITQHCTAFSSPPPSESFMDQLDRLSFGYEKKSGSQNSLPSLSLRRTKEQGNFNSSSAALCYPNQVRPRGCEFLLYDKSKETAALTNSRFSAESLGKLPCVTGGSCPFVRFSCSNGHEWNALPGSPVCFQCPRCPKDKAYLRQIFGFPSKKTKNKAAASTNDVMKKLTAHADAKGGRCLIDTSAPLSLSLKWKDSVRFQCADGHRWSTTVSNVIAKRSWCRICEEKKRAPPDFMDSTAHHFSGRFLEYVSSSVSGVDDETDAAIDASAAAIANSTNTQSSTLKTALNLPEPAAPKLRTQPRSLRLALWECAKGHQFEQSANNIRRAAGGRRKCSWCPQCAADGIRFEWKG